MTKADSLTYTEASATVRSLRLAHTSIEVGHLYMEDMATDDDKVRAHFRRVRPWLAAARAGVEVAGRAPRVSTCFLIDDYFPHSAQPGPTLDRLMTIAAECGVSIDYLVRESGCCVADDGIQLAELVESLLLPEPPPGTNGSRPPVQESGWLCNGERSDDVGSDQAMRAGQWRAPHEFGKRNHSVFLDVELWKLDRETSHRTWSCAFLAAVWQLLRLGMLRYYGEPVVRPTVWESGTPWPETWADLPVVLQLNPEAESFTAYRSVSIMPSSFLPIEHAVVLILGHLNLDQVVTEQIVARGAKEGLAIPRSVAERISHIFVDGV